MPNSFSASTGQAEHDFFFYEIFIQIITFLYLSVIMYFACIFEDGKVESNVISLLIPKLSPMVEDNLHLLAMICYSGRHPCLLVKT